jgi:hypothetical protein
MTGLTEGEGCFCISFTQRKKLNTGIEVRPSFSISQNEKNLELLKRVRQCFDCGGIRYSSQDRNYKFEVRSIDDLIKIIIPHFEKYPLIGAKAVDFEKFAQICWMMRSNLHRNKEGLIKIIDLAYQINYGKRKYSKEELLRHMVR